MVDMMQSPLRNPKAIQRKSLNSPFRKRDLQPFKPQRRGSMDGLFVCEEEHSSDTTTLSSVFANNLLAYLDQYYLVEESSSGPSQESKIDSSAMRKCRSMTALDQIVGTLPIYNPDQTLTKPDFSTKLTDKERIVSLNGEARKTDYLSKSDHGARPSSSKRNYKASITPSSQGQERSSTLQRTKSCPKLGSYSRKVFRRGRKPSSISRDGADKSMAFKWCTSLETIDEFRSKTRFENEKQKKNSSMSRRVHSQPVVSKDCSSSTDQRRKTGTVCGISSSLLNDLRKDLTRKPKSKNTNGMRRSSSSRRSSTTETTTVPRNSSWKKSLDIAIAVCEK